MKSPQLIESSVNLTFNFLEAHCEIQSVCRQTLLQTQRIQKEKTYPHQSL